MRPIIFSFLFACSDKNTQDDDNKVEEETSCTEQDSVGDGLDQNCDGIDGVDADQDGYASQESGGTDCDDFNNTIYPGAEEIEGDGVDQDCDGTDPAGEETPDEDDTDEPEEEEEAEPGSDEDVPVEVTVEMDAPEADKGGCSSVGVTQGSPAAWTLAFLGLVGWRRRRAN